MGRSRFPLHVQAAIDAAVSGQDARLPRARRLELTLPFPPSVNGLYATVVTQDGLHMRVKTKRGKFYDDAVRQALAAWKREHGLRPPAPPYALTLYVYPPRDRRKHDLTNMFKAPEDALFAAIGQDDNDVTRVVARKFDPSAEPRIVLILEGNGER
jgi:Holliday junction resolvase RusA-like endonuclease